VAKFVYIGVDIYHLGIVKEVKKMYNRKKTLEIFIKFSLISTIQGVLKKLN